MDSITTASPSEETAATSVSQSATTITGEDTPGCIMYNIATRVVIAGFIVVFGVAGNLITIVIMGRERNKSATITMLTYLAIVDSFILIVNGFLTMAHPLISIFGSIFLAENVKVFMVRNIGLSYIGQTLVQISVFFTLIVTWQRYISICMPHKAKSLTSKKLTNRLAVWSIIISVLFYLPSFCQFNIKRLPGGWLQLKLTVVGKSWFFKVIYSGVILYSINYVIPVILFIFMASQLIRNLREAKKKRTVASSATKKAQEEITISLVVVVIVFILFQSIKPIHRLLIWLYIPSHSRAMICRGELFYLGPFIMLSPLFNSAANFVIYVLFARGFRRKVASLIGRTTTAVSPLEMSSNVSTLGSCS